jgi:hypothetical protein
VQAIEATGLRVNRQPVMRLRLRVLPPDAAPYDAEVRVLMPHGSPLPSLGREVAVLAHPNDPSKVELAPD